MNLVYSTQCATHVLRCIDGTMLYDIVRKLFDELFPLFPDQAFHLGGDEVATACWNADASITSWMRENGYASNSTGKWVYEFRRLQAYWMQFVQGLVKQYSAKKQAVVWEEAFTDAKEIPLLNGTHTTSLHPSISHHGQSYMHSLRIRCCVVDNES